MIYQIIDLPPTMIGFKASWDVTKQDFEEVVIPCIQKHVEKKGQLNYMLVLTESIRNFSFCEWLKDVMVALKRLTKWNRAAIVTDSKSILFFTQLFNYFMPGEFKGFAHNEMDRAIYWVSEADKNGTTI